MIKFVVVFATSANGSTWYLRGTVATGELERATKFLTEDAARAGLANAAKFMKKSAVKTARIVPIEVEGQS